MFVCLFFPRGVGCQSIVVVVDCWSSSLFHAFHAGCIYCSVFSSNTKDISSLTWSIHSLLTIYFLSSVRFFLKFFFPSSTLYRYISRSVLELNFPFVVRAHTKVSSSSLVELSNPQICKISLHVSCWLVFCRRTRGTSGRMIYLYGSDSFVPLVSTTSYIMHRGSSKSSRYRRYMKISPSSRGVHSASMRDFALADRGRMIHLKGFGWLNI